MSDHLISRASLLWMLSYSFFFFLKPGALYVHYWIFLNYIIGFMKLYENVNRFIVWSVGFAASCKNHTGISLKNCNNFTRQNWEYLWIYINCMISSRQKCTEGDKYIKCIERGVTICRWCSHWRLYIFGTRS